ncbi:ABC transporter ATP-binding protein [Rhizobium oryzicola]|uniref:ATP-binding cassette domain-containing protein n=1 Tax=Rhizobium oryzicola TaxID=1232668 RepID=A0ABT8T2R7_9HYPH|nr:oligopeptide/dipeptide ABC transporter ATP-binding protein [Rhizobium oryzicola]MDO1585030.1 ATP-binding cassette domain-containing protein [Rhizobium oryzicola]
MTDTSLAPDILMDVADLRKHFPITSGFFGRQTGAVRAVDGVSFQLRKGETLGLVGESGSGKSTVARLMLRAFPVTDGRISFRRRNGSVIDLAKASGPEMREVRDEVQMIFQDPYSSLNPRLRLLEIIGEPLINKGIAKSEIEDRVGELLKLVGLRPEFMSRYPHAFSGGQRQRIGIARALAVNPTFIAADEAVSALDVSVAAQVVNLLQDLQDQFGLTYLFITHDLSMVEHIANRIGVMYLGRLVEIADTRSLFDKPRHPYTEALLSSVPQPDPRANAAKKRIILKGEIPNAAKPPSGCVFHPRCPYATDLCKQVEPVLEALPSGNAVRCHRAAELDLAGVR